MLVHGHRGTKASERSKTYNSWRAMIQRCTLKTHDNYLHYGGRGIKVCQRWRKFANFLKDMGKRPKNKTLDRIDVNKGYNLKNCKWSTVKQQSNNKRK